MILTVDIGNTHIEIGIFKDGELRKSWRIATGVDRTEDEFMLFVRHFLDQENPEHENLEGVALSSVVPNITSTFEKMCEKYLNIKPLVVDHTLNLGIKILYSDPAAVGPDRICNAVAAYSRFKQAAVVIDFGTATTFDVVNGSGEYLGGIICPGVETTAWALHRRAAMLPKISLEFPEHAIGRDTNQSMQSGIMLGTVKMIEGLLEMVTGELGEKPRVVATGGLARLIRPHTNVIESDFPYLVLDGLYRIYKLNT